MGGGGGQCNGTLGLCICAMYGDTVFAVQFCSTVLQYPVRVWWCSTVVHGACTKVAVQGDSICIQGVALVWGDTVWGGPV